MANKTQGPHIVVKIYEAGGVEVFSDADLAKPLDGDPASALDTSKHTVKKIDHATWFTGSPL